MKYSLVRHIRHECLQVRKFSCPECYRPFGYGFLVLRHLQTVHKMSLGMAHTKLGAT